MSTSNNCLRIGAATIAAVAFISLVGSSRGIDISATVLAASDPFQSSPANGLDPATIHVQLPSEIKWTESKATGSLTATLYGDPTEPGLYITLNKWPAHKMGLPHTHPNDRFITVISGTWWVGTGAKFDPDRTVPVSAGSFVTHFAKQVHFDGAKDEDAVLEVVGMGPGTATPVTDTQANRTTKMYRPSGLKGD